MTIHAGSFGPQPLSESVLAGAVPAPAVEAPVAVTAPPAGPAVVTVTTTDVPVAAPEELSQRFAPQGAPTAEQLIAHEQARHICSAAAASLYALLPDGRAKAVVMTKIEEAMHWSQAAISARQAQ